MLLAAVVLTLLAVPVEPWWFGSGSSSSSSSSSSGSNPPDFNYPDNLSGSKLRELLNSPVVTAEKVERPLRIFPLSFLPPMGSVSHSGVRVTLEDDSQWLIHKGDKHGISSQTVVTRADNMSPKWRETGESRDFNGERTVSDLVRAGGETYDVRNSNCHKATHDILNLDK